MLAEVKDTGVSRIQAFCCPVSNLFYVLGPHYSVGALTNEGKYSVHSILCRYFYSIL